MDNESSKRKTNNKRSNVSEWDSSFDNELKALSSSEIEKIVANALSRAVRADFTVKIRSIDYQPDDAELESTTRTEVTMMIERREKTILE